MTTKEHNELIENLFDAFKNNPRIKTYKPLHSRNIYMHSMENNEWKPVAEYNSDLSGINIGGLLYKKDEKGLLKAVGIWGTKIIKL